MSVRERGRRTGVTGVGSASARGVRAPLVVLAAAAGLLAAAACAAGESDAPAEPVATTRVEMPRHYRFAPEAIRVPSGATVTWRNTDDFTHTVRLEEGDGAVHTVAPGDSVRLTFDAPGRYPYVCTLHPHDMRGVVVVEASGG